MSATLATLGITLSSAGGINSVGPVALPDIPISMALVQEIEATVLQADVADTVLIPTVGLTQALLYVQTDQPIGMKINAEAVVRTLTPPAAGKPAIFLLLGGPPTTQLVFSGNLAATGPASVLIIVGGN